MSVLTILHLPIHPHEGSSITCCARPSRHWASPRESAEFPTDVKEVVTLLVKSRQSISKAVGRRFTTAMDSVSLAFKRRMQGHSSARF
jgi:hypothetical protein